MSSGDGRWGKDWSNKAQGKAYDIYYSHSRKTLGSEEEREELAYLESICEPSMGILNPLVTVPKGGDFALAVASCKRVIVSTVRWTGGTYIGMGVASDIDNALRFGIPVFLLRVGGGGQYSLVKVRGYIRLEDGEPELRYAILNIEWSRDWNDALAKIVHYKTLMAQAGRYRAGFAPSEDDIRAVFDVQRGMVLGNDVPPFDLDFDTLVSYLASLPQEEIEGILNLVQDITTSEEWYSFRVFLNGRATKTAFMPETCPSCGTVTMRSPREKLGKCPTCGNPVSFMLVAEVI